MKNLKLQEYLADLSIILISVIWGSSFIIIKQAIETFEPITFIFLRFLVASVFMAILTIPFRKHYNKQSIKDGAIMGFVLFLIFLFQTIALKLSTATEVGFLTGLYVLFVPILSTFFLKKSPHFFSWIGVALSAVGMIMITFQGELHLSTGQLFGIINAFFIGIHILMIDVMSRKHNVIVLTAMQIFVTCLFSGLYAFFFESSPLSMALEPSIAYPIIYTGVVATVLCFFLQTSMQKYTTPTKAAIMFTLEPISSAIFGFYIGHEIMTKNQYLGAALIIFAIVVAEAGTAIRHSLKQFVSN